MYDIKNLTAFDTETHLVQPGILAPPIVCGSFAVQGKDPILVVGSDRVCQELEHALDEGWTVVGAFIAYDLACVAAAKPALLPKIFRAYEEGKVYDIQIAQALDAIAKGLLGRDPRVKGDRYSLESCVRIMLGRDDAKRNDFWRLRYAILEKVPLEFWPEKAKQYPRDDAKNTLEVAIAQIQKPLENLHNMREQARAAFALHLASVWGLRTDGASVAQLEKELKEKHTEEVSRFTGIFLKSNGQQDGQALKRRVAVAYGVDPGSTCPVCQGEGKVKSEKTKAQVICKAALGGCDGTGLDINVQGLPRTDTGGISADRDTLEESGDELLESYAGVSKTRKLLDTYIPFLKQGVEAPINVRSNPLVASGRTSYEGLIQLLPREGGVRDCFVPREGSVFCSIDYSGLELATFSQCQIWVVGSSYMGELINEGKDLHLAFAATMVGISYEEALQRKKAGDKQILAYRQAAKSCNFGFCGGLGAAKFVTMNRKVGFRFCQILEGAEKCGVEKVYEWKGRPTPPLCKRCVELAEDLRDQWFQQWPEIKPYFNFVASNVDTTGCLEQFVSKRIRGGLDFCSGANTLFQGLAADGAKHALYLVSKECYTDKDSPLYGVRPVIFVHDEIFSEMREEIAHIAAPRMAEIMVNAMQEYTPDIKQRAEPALMRKWLKGAEPAYDSEGKLIPWEPEEKEA